MWATEEIPKCQLYFFVIFLSARKVKIRFAVLSEHYENIYNRT